MAKVYNIDAPRVSQTYNSTRPDYTRPATPSNGQRQPVGSSKTSKRVLLAYLLGPLAPAFWNTGSHRIAWGIAAAASFVFLTMSLTVGSTISHWVLQWSGGVQAWLVIVPGLVIALVTLWTLAIIEATRRESASRSYPGWLSNSVVALILGAVVPGLGMRVTGRPGVGARMFWILAPLFAASIILANWRALWERSLSASPGVAGMDLEIVFLVATGVVILSLLAWLIQALEGPRRLSDAGSVVRSNIISAMLLLSLMAAGMLFQPSSIASELHATSMVLRETGFRFIPLGLCETAARLDPAEPIYLADAAELNKALGMTDAAAEKRHKLERRMQAFIRVVDPERKDWNSAAASPQVIGNQIETESPSQESPIVPEQ